MCWPTWSQFFHALARVATLARAWTELQGSVEIANAGPPSSPERSRGVWRR
jgi:hypothetical protein